MKRFDFAYGDDGFDDDEDEDQEDQENNFIDSQMIAMQMEQNVLIEQEIQAKLVEEAYKICKGSWIWILIFPRKKKKRPDLINSAIS